jgi:hypothetical protein
MAAKLTKKKYPSLEVKTSEGQILLYLDGNSEVGGVCPHEFSYEVDEGVIDVYNEGGDFTGRIKLPENCFVYIQNNPKTYA